MERQSFMKKSEGLVPAMAGSDLLDGLEFPIAPDFESMLLPGVFEEVYRACEEMLPTALALPDAFERRQTEGITAEFVF